jgi:raffinose/stachyose/melibiose transport system substrate-binding protein
MMSGKATFEDPRWVGAVKRYAELKPYFSDGFSGVDYTTSTQQFIGGKAAMFFGGSFENGSFKAQNPNLKFSMFPFPADDAATPLYTSAFSDGSWAGLGKRQQGCGAQSAELHGISPVRAALRRRAWLAAGPHRRHRQGAGAGQDDGNIEERDAVLTLVGFRWQTPTASSVLQAEIIDTVEGKIAPEKLAADIQAAVNTWFKPKN